MPTGSCSRRSKQTAHSATRRSGCRLWHCTLGRLALLFRLLSLPQPFRSALFSSARTEIYTHSVMITAAHQQPQKQQQLKLKQSTSEKKIFMYTASQKFINGKLLYMLPRSSEVEVATNLLNFFS